jgi:hypothetical protein
LEGACAIKRRSAGFYLCVRTLHRSSPAQSKPQSLQTGVIITDTEHGLRSGFAAPAGRAVSNFYGPWACE